MLDVLAVVVVWGRIKGGQAANGSGGFRTAPSFLSKVAKSTIN